MWLTGLKAPINHLTQTLCGGAWKCESRSVAAPPTRGLDGCLAGVDLPVCLLSVDSVSLPLARTGCRSDWCPALELVPTGVCRCPCSISDSVVYFLTQCIPVLFILEAGFAGRGHRPLLFSYINEQGCIKSSSTAS